MAMRARAVCFGAVVLAAGVASADDPKPTKVDLKPLREQLVVLQDGHGGTYLVKPGDGARVFFATKTTFYEQVVVGRSQNGDGWGVSTWAPRIDKVQPGVVQRRADDGSYEKWCGQVQTGLTLVSSDKAKQILDKATVMTTPLVRHPHLLARDDAGVYYYVDALRREFGGKGFRVFVGKKGAMKLQTLTDVASDTAGEVFASKTGDLRLVHAENSDVAIGSATWVRGEKKQPLVVLDTDANSPLIYKDLGIYDFLGTICDDTP